MFVFVFLVIGEESGGVRSAAGSEIYLGLAVA